MRRLNCGEVDRELWRYVDRELPATAVAAVSEHLKGCDACQALYHERAREANLCRGFLAASALGAESSSRIVKAMEREGLFREAPWDRGTRGQVVRARDRFRGRLALAAMLLIALTVGLGWILRGDTPARLGEFVADGVVFRSSEPGAPAEVFSSGSCMSGNQFVVGEDVVLTLKLGTPLGRPGATLTVSGPAKLTLGAASTPDEFSALLDSGVLKAAVQPREAIDGVRPFVIETPEAVVSVVGTEFVLDRTVEGVTRLDVSHGAVDFRPVDAPIEAPVGQPELLVTADTGPRVIRRGDRLPGLPTAPVSVTETADDPAAAPGAETPAGGATAVEIDASVPVELPGGGTGSTGAPALNAPADDAAAVSQTVGSQTVGSQTVGDGSGGLDQVVNPSREEKDEE